MKDKYQVVPQPATTKKPAKAEVSAAEFRRRLRASTKPEEYGFMANSYLAEIEKMNAEILEYLKRHPSQIVPAEAA